MGPAASSMLVLAGCAVLVWSGLEKLRDRSPLTSSLVALGFPRRLAGGVATACPVLELGTVATVGLGAPDYLSSGLFVALGTSFAAVAGWSLVTRRAVPCACFGRSGGTLGWRQLGALPIWLLVGWAALQLPATKPEQLLAVLAYGILVLAAARAIPAMRASVAARNDRRALVGG
jgi:hypothetical protein